MPKYKVKLEGKEIAFVIEELCVYNREMGIINIIIP